MFDFNRLSFETTLARQIARQHLTNLNNVFWVGERSHKLVRKSFTSIDFPAPAPGVHGIYANEEQWKHAVNEFRVWQRQHVLLSTASLLEVYVKSASTAALSACPDIVDKSLDGIDSTSYLKHPDCIPKHLRQLIEERVEGFTKGTWSERLRRVGNVFGKIPASVTAAAFKLQSIQDKRNKIAHSYGANGELRKTPWEKISDISINPSDLIEATKVISDVIKSLDIDLFGPKIGGYEIVYEFDVWSRKQKNLGRMRVNGSLVNAFSEHIGRAFGRTPGNAYLKDLVIYYDSIR